jgi:creatinine amidohydrolase
MSPLMSQMTWPEIDAAARRGAAAVWTVGSTEQHGPHLPVSVDTVIPTRLAERVAEALDLVIVPPQVFGFRSRPLSGGGQGFPGTTSLRAETLIGVVRDVVGEIARSGFRRIVIINWHGENVNLLYEGVELAREAGLLAGARVQLIERVLNGLTPADCAFLFADTVEGFPGWPAEHAAVMETSLMLELAPELVRTERIIDDRSAQRPFYDVIPTPPEHIAASGVLAEATKASPEKGRRLAALLVSLLSAAMVEALAVPAVPPVPGDAAGGPAGEVPR